MLPDSSTEFDKLIIHEDFVPGIRDEEIRRPAIGIGVLRECQFEGGFSGGVVVGGRPEQGLAGQSVWSNGIVFAG